MGRSHDIQKPGASSMLIRQTMQDRITEGWPVEEIAKMHGVSVEEVREVEADPGVRPGEGIVENAEARAREAGVSLATIQSRDELPGDLAEELDRGAV